MCATKIVQFFTRDKIKTGLGIDVGHNNVLPPIKKNISNEADSLFESIQLKTWNWIETYFLYSYKSPMYVHNIPILYISSILGFIATYEKEYCKWSRFIIWVYLVQTLKLNWNLFFVNIQIFNVHTYLYYTFHPFQDSLPRKLKIGCYRLM